METKLDLKKVKSIDIVNGDPSVSSPSERKSIIPGFIIPHCGFEPFGMNFTDVLRSYCLSGEECIVLEFRLVGTLENKPMIKFFPKKFMTSEWYDLPEETAMEIKQKLNQYVEFVAAWYIHIAKEHIKKFEERKVFIETIASY